MTNDLESLKQAVVPLVEEEVSSVTVTSYDHLREWLIERIGELIDRNFEQLLRVLYLIDVDERKVRTLVAEHGGQDAPAVIADLILQRQMEKIRSRQKFKPGKDGKYFG